MLAALALTAAALASPAAERWLEARIGLCSLAAPPEAATAFRALAARAPALLEQVETHLGIRAAAPYRMILVPGTTLRDSALRVLDEQAPPWAAGYMLPGARVGAIRLDQAARYPYGTPESVLAHEVTHLLVHDALGHRVPLWFDEGVATWEGRRWTLEDAWIVSATVLTSDLPALADLDSLFHGDEADAQKAYAAASGFVAWSTRRTGPAFVRSVIREARQVPFEVAWRRAGGRTLAEDEADWRRASLIRYRWIPILTASSTLWAALAGLGALAGLLRRARARRARQRWPDDEDEAETSGEPEARDLESVPESRPPGPEPPAS